MPTQPAYISDSTSPINPSGFLQQLRRLESLQLLMTQGSTVVNEVVEFMAKARAELESLRQEQAEAVRLQDLADSENGLMRARISSLEQQLESSEVRVKEQDLQVARMRTELAAAVSAISREELSRERELHEEALQKQVSRVTEAEAEIVRERTSRAQALQKMRTEESARHAAELQALSAKIETLEKQLAAERERRVRLMDVLKAHEVTVAPPIPHREKV